MKKIYLQILGFNDIKFYPDFARMINESGQFKKDEFIFVTWHKNVYKEIKQYDNVLLLNKKNELFKWLLKSKWIFMHANCFSKIQTILLPKFICKKIIWRTWGHDIRKLDYKKCGFLRKIVDLLYIKKINNFRGIGIANEIDAINVQNVFGNKIKTYLLHYTYKNNQKELMKKIEQEKMIDEKNEIRILIGHNAGKAENHIENLNRLSKYSNEKIKIILPISYSNEDIEYVNLIKKTAIQLFEKEKIEFIEKFLEYNEYVKLINSCDIAIMDQKYSNGLGNLSLLIYFKKKIFVNRNGNVAQSFLTKNIMPNYADLIGKLSFEEFVENKFDDNLFKYIEQTGLIKENASIENFKKILEVLN